MPQRPTYYTRGTCPECKKTQWHRRGARLRINGTWHEDRECECGHHWYAKVVPIVAQQLDALRPSVTQVTLDI